MPSPAGDAITHPHQRYLQLPITYVRGPSCVTGNNGIPRTPPISSMVDASSPPPPPPSRSPRDTIRRANGADRARDRVRARRAGSSGRRVASRRPQQQQRGTCGRATKWWAPSHTYVSLSPRAIQPPTPPGPANLLRGRLVFFPCLLASTRGQIKRRDAIRKATGLLLLVATAKLSGKGEKRRRHERRGTSTA